MNKFFLFILLVPSLVFPSASSPGDHNKLVRKQNDIITMIERLNMKIQSLVYKNSKVRVDLLSLESSLAEINEQIQNIQGEIEVYRNQVRKKMLFISRTSGSTLLSGLVNSRSPSELHRHIRILSRLSAQDLQKIREYNSLYKMIDIKKNQLDQRKVVLEKKQLELREMEKALSKEMDLKVRLLDRIRLAQNKAKKDLQALRQKALLAGETEKAELYGNLLRPSFYGKRGKLSTPSTMAKVKQGFGVWKDKDNKVNLFHPGIFFEAEQGTPIKAVAEGIIAFVGPVLGYGQTVIIDQGDNYYTVYSHLKNTRVGVNQDISANSILGYSAGDSETFGKGFYFELRHFTEPENPQKWFQTETRTNIVIDEQRGRNE